MKGNKLKQLEPQHPKKMCHTNDPKYRLNTA